MAYLGQYYADKQRCAAKLMVYRLGGRQDASWQEQAVEHIEDSRDHWKQYADVLDSHYKTSLHAKTGWFRWYDTLKSVEDEVQRVKGEGALPVIEFVGLADGDRSMGPYRSSTCRPSRSPIRAAVLASTLPVCASKASSRSSFSSLVSVCSNPLAAVSWWITGHNAVSRWYGEHRYLMRRKPSCANASNSARHIRDLPIPASPTNMIAWPSPALLRAQRSINSASSCSRPIIVPTDCPDRAEKRSWEGSPSITA